MLIQAAAAALEGVDPAFALGPEDRMALEQARREGGGRLGTISLPDGSTGTVMLPDGGYWTDD